MKNVIGFLLVLSLITPFTAILFCNLDVVLLSLSWMQAGNLQHKQTLRKVNVKQNGVIMNKEFVPKRRASSLAWIWFGYKETDN